MSEIVNCCIQSNINTKIENLPDKYETNVGQLSPSDRIRICIARAMIREPKILLWDNPSVDDHNQSAALEETLEKIKCHRTSLVTGQRLTRPNAHKISVFREGHLKSLDS